MKQGAIATIGCNLVGKYATQSWTGPKQQTTALKTPKKRGSEKENIFLPRFS